MTPSKQEEIKRPVIHISNADFVCPKGMNIFDDTDKNNVNTKANIKNILLALIDSIDSMYITIDYCTFTADENTDKIYCKESQKQFNLQFLYNTLNNIDMPLNVMNLKTSANTSS